MKTYQLPLKTNTFSLPIDTDTIVSDNSNNGGCNDSDYRLPNFIKLMDEKIIRNYQFSKINYDFPLVATIKDDRLGYAISSANYNASTGLLQVTYDASPQVGFIELLISGTYPNTEILEYLQTLEIVAVGVFV